MCSNMQLCLKIIFTTMYIFTKRLPRNLLNFIILTARDKESTNSLNGKLVFPQENCRSCVKMQTTIHEQSRV